MEKLLCTSTTCELVGECYRHVSNYPHALTGEEVFKQLEPASPDECEYYDGVNPE